MFKGVLRGRGDRLNLTLNSDFHKDVALNENKLCASRSSK